MTSLTTPFLLAQSSLLILDGPIFSRPVSTFPAPMGFLISACDVTAVAL
jgi:hypothetical protein